jgi:glycosyltransferase involved in cell wall biosynthesis
MTANDLVFQQSPSLRVAVVTETYPPEVNGVAMTLGRLVEALQRRRHCVQLVRPRQGASDTAAHGEQFEEVLKAGIPIPRYDGLQIGLPAKQGLMRLWALKRPDIVHIATEGPLGWSALAAATQLKLPVSTGFHTNFHSYCKHYGIGFLKKPIAAYLRKFHNRALATLVPTEGLRDELEGHGFKNLHVVSRGVDALFFSPSRRSRNCAGCGARVSMESLPCTSAGWRRKRIFRSPSELFWQCTSEIRKCNWSWSVTVPNARGLPAAIPM